MKIEVTQEDIRNGQRGNPCECPIAIACHRAFPDASYVRIQSIAFIDDRDYAMPEESHDFMRKFDLQGPSAVSPFTFDLE